MKQNNINFIFGLLDRKKVALCLFIEAFLDFIYYVIPYTFALFLTMPFTIEKAIIVASIFIASKSVRCFVLYLERKVMDNYLYDYSNVQYLEYYKKLTKVPVETLSKYQTGYLENIIEKISELVKKILSAEYIGILLSFGFFFLTVFQQSKILFVTSLVLSILCVMISVYILKKSNKHVEDLYDKEYEYSSVYQDFISNIRTVKALNDNKYFEKIISKEGKECYKKQNKYVKCYSLEEFSVTHLFTQLGQSFFKRCGPLFCSRNKYVPNVCCSLLRMSTTAVLRPREVLKTLIHIHAEFFC